MIIELYKLRPTFFCRPIDSRYQLAQRLVAGSLPAPFRGWADAVVERAAAALRGDSPDDAFEAALRLRRGGPPLDRGEIDGRILANHTAEIIATSLKLPVDVVELYESLFFDVRMLSIDRRRQAAGGAAVGYGVTSPEALIRWAGYRGMLSTVVTYFRNRLDERIELKEGPDLAGEELKAMRYCRGWLEVMALPLDEPAAVLAFQYGIRLPTASPAMTDIRESAPEPSGATAR